MKISAERRREISESFSAVDLFVFRGRAGRAELEYRVELLAKYGIEVALHFDIESRKWFLTRGDLPAGVIPILCRRTDELSAGEMLATLNGLLMAQWIGCVEGITWL